MPPGFARVNSRIFSHLGRRRWRQPQDCAVADSLKAPPPKVYNGRQGQTSVHIPRLDDLEIIDGTLNDPVWQQAAVLTGFSEYTPIDGLPAEDSTEVLVWYSHKAIYFGIRAFEPHGVVALQARRS